MSDSADKSYLHRRADEHTVYPFSTPGIALIAAVLYLVALWIAV